MKQVWLLVITLLVLVMPGCTNIAQVEATDQYVSSENLSAFCEIQVDLMNELFYSVAATNGRLGSLLHEDTKNFVPILFAQCKMENIGIMLFSVITEVSHISESGKITDTATELLDIYIHFLEWDMIKARLFKGLTKNDGELFNESDEQLALKVAVVNLTAAHDLFVEIREGLEELK